jgi:hypothetical protein
VVRERTPLFSIHQLRNNSHRCGGDLTTRRRGTDLVRDDSELLFLSGETQNRQQKIAALRGVDPLGAKDQVKRTAFSMNEGLRRTIEFWPKKLADSERAMRATTV